MRRLIAVVRRLEGRFHVYTINGPRSVSKVLDTLEQAWWYAQGVIDGWKIGTNADGEIAPGPDVGDPMAKEPDDAQGLS